MRPHRPLLLALGIIGLVACTCAQDDPLPSGIYMDLEELRSRRPSVKVRLQVDRRSDGNVAMSGGNDHKITDPTDSLPKKFLKRDVFAYVSNDSLFLNCERQELGPWYSFVVSRGEFLVFSSPEAGNSGTTAAILGGAIGGAIAGATYKPSRPYFIMSMRTGTSRTLTKEYLIARFKDRGKTELLEKYNAEPLQDDNFFLLRYANLLNESLATDPPR